MIKDIIKTIATGSLIVASTMLAFAAANADGGQCAPLERTSYGKVMDADVSAHIYSQENVGHVGISIYPGADLDKYSPDYIGQRIVSVLAQAGVDAECFVNDSMFENSGTAISFKIKGISIKLNGKDHFGISKVSRDARVLSTVTAEAKMVKQLIAPN